MVAICPNSHVSNPPTNKTPAARLAKCATDDPQHLTAWHALLNDQLRART